MSHAGLPARLVVAGLTAAASLGACAPAPDPDVIRVSGYVEATEVRVSAEVGGRIVARAVDEGDRVSDGDLVARLDTADTELARDRARAERNLAEAQLALLLAGSRPEDIRQADAALSARAAELEAARAELAAAETDLDRFERLLQSASGSEKQRDDAATRRDVAAQRVRAAEQGVEAAREALIRLRSGARPEEIAAARARVGAADAQIAVLDKALADATVVSPASGIVTETIVDAGELVAPRTPLVVLTDLDRAWANVYVDEPLVPRLRLGQAATIVTDAGDAGLPGRITYISPRAEFTPRNVQTASERAKLVYRVKVSTDTREGVLKPGMPVEAEIGLHPVRGRRDP